MSPTNTPKDLRFISPVSGRMQVTNGFYQGRFRPNLNKNVNHGGLDIVTSTGTPIGAIGDGVVAAVNTDGTVGTPKPGDPRYSHHAAGNAVFIDHPNGFRSEYMHLKTGTIKVKVGDKVTAGQVIAQSNSTGTDTEHLHLILRKDGTAIDPLDYIRPGDYAPSQPDNKFVPEWPIQQTGGVATSAPPAAPTTPQLPTENTDSYIEKIYTSVYSTDANIKKKYDEFLLNLIKSFKSTMLSDSGMNGDLRLLQLLDTQQSNVQGEIANATKNISGFSVSAQKDLIDHNLYALDPDAMRTAMVNNADKYNPANGPSSSHAWRAPGKVAITATFTIQGMSGFKIAQVFWLDRISEYYKSFGVFQIFGLTERIDVSKGWTTEIYSRFNSIPPQHLSRLIDTEAEKVFKAVQATGFII